MITTYQYVFDLRNRIEDKCTLALENLLTAQQKYKKHFDKSARLRTMDIGERVLVMLPTYHNKLLLRWKGPYPIMEKVGVADYRIKIGEQLRLFHINMLRKYIDRASPVCSSGHLRSCGMSGVRHQRNTGIREGNLPQC